MTAPFPPLRYRLVGWVTRPRLTVFVGLAIAIFIATAVVSSATSVIAYFVSYSAVSDAGAENVNADVVRTILDIERYLQPLQSDAKYVVAAATSSNLGAPAAAANVSAAWAQLSIAAQSLMPPFRARPSAYGIANIVFADGSWVSVMQPTRTSPGYLYQVLAPASGDCGGSVHKRYFNVTTNAVIASTPAAAAAGSALGEAGCKQTGPVLDRFFRTNFSGYGIPFVLIGALPPRVFVTYGMALPLAPPRGGTPYCMAMMSASMDKINAYLTAAVTTGIASVALLVDEKRRVLVSTLTDRPIAFLAPKPAANCLPRASNVTPGNVSAVCLYTVQEYGYGPAIDALSKGFYDPASYPHYGNETLARTRDVKVAIVYANGRFGSSCVVGGARLKASLLGYYVTIFVPESALFGDMANTRTLLTVLTVALTVGLSTVACVINWLFFRRLRRSADRVRSAALFRGSANTDASPSLSASSTSDYGGGGGGDYGWITEVRNLEAAQQNLTVFYRALSGYMPKDVLRTLTVGGVPDVETQVKCAVLSADFTGFSSAACCGLAGPTVTLLSTLLYKATVDVLQQTAGTMLHFSGDGFVAAWGAGRKAPNMEARAALAGVLLQRAMKLDSVMDPFVDANEMPFVHIGLHCGVASVGVLGTPERLTLHVVGDLTLQAARLKARAALYDTRPLASEPFAKRLGKLFVMRQMVFPVEVDTDVQTAVTRRERTSTMMNSMRVVKSFELVGLASTESPDDLSRLRVNDNRINAEQQQQQQEATRPQANALGSAAGGAKLKARGRSVSPTAAAATARDKSSSAIIQRSDDDSLLGDVASGAFMRGSIDAREAPGSYNTLQLFDSVRGLPECTLEPGEFDLSLVKAYNQVSRAFLKGRFSTVVRRANRILSKLQADDPYVATLQVLVAMAQRAEHRTRR